MPKALVATITSTSPSRNARCAFSRALRAQAGVVDRRLPAAAGEPRRLLLGAPARRRVDDGDARRRCRGRPSASASTASTCASRSRASSTSTARRREVGPREAVDVLRRVRGQAEAGQDLVAHDGRGGGGAGEHARGGQLGEQAADLQVLRPEVVAPFADAVRLVDGHQRDGHVAQQAAEALEDEPLRGDVDQRVLALRPCAPSGGGPPARRGWRPGRSRSRRARPGPGTWSFIKATSGEMTSVVPRSDTAGSW